jgi:hypothetical protein
MKRLHRIKYWHLIILALVVVVGLFAAYSANRARENTPLYQFRQSVMDEIERYMEENPDGEGGRDYRQGYFFHLNSNESISIFYNAIRKSMPMDYETYVARSNRNRNTSEPLAFILPCLEEQFYYSPKNLHCFEKGLVFEMKKKDSKKLYEIITRLR